MAKTANKLNWFIPTFHGDIALEHHGDIVLVKIEKLVPSEIEALNALRTKALADGWIREPEGVGYRESNFFPEPTADLVAQVALRADIHDVVKMLTASLKPNRKQLSVVKFRDGKIEEITDTNYEKAVARGKSAATVAAPTQGCPLPEFDKQFHRARRVLAEFLTPEQLSDFDKENAFVSRGVDTGHRYLLRSREAGRGHESFRTLYDLEEQQPFCIHDWTVPAPEELLALHLHLQVPGQEIYMRGVPDLGQHG